MIHSPVQLLFGAAEDAAGRGFSFSIARDWSGFAAKWLDHPP